MKKKAKLRLHRETLRCLDPDNLSDGTLRLVAGGDASKPPSCPETCAGC